MMNTIKSAILIALIAILSNTGLAQDSTFVAVDSIESTIKINFPWALSIEGQFESLNLNFDDHMSTYYGMGAEFKRILAGFYYREYISNGEEKVIFPNTFSLHSSSGGAYIGYRLIDRKYFGLSSRMLIGSGDILWRRVDNDIDFVREKFTELKPEVLFEFEPTIITQLYLGIGYKFVSDFDIPSFQRENILGLTFTAGLKLGFFYKNNEED